MEHDPVEWVGDPDIDQAAYDAIAGEASDEELAKLEEESYERWNRRNIPTEIWAGGRRIWTRITEKFRREKDTYWLDYEREVDRSQQIRIVRCKLGQGRLWQGRMEDSLQFKEGIHFQVGHTNLATVNDKVVRVKYTISDGPNTVYDWQQVMRMAYWAIGALNAGHDVLITCDMGASRSVTMASIIIAVMDGVPFDENLRFAMRNPNYDNPPWKGFLPNPQIWREAKVVVDVMRNEAIGKASWDYIQSNKQPSDIETGGIK